MISEKVKLETLTEFQVLELMHIAVHTVLEDVANGRVIEGVPKLTPEQLEGVSFGSSLFEHRIKFYPEENRDITVSIKAEEYQYEGEELVEPSVTLVMSDLTTQGSGLILDTMEKVKELMNFSNEQLFSHFDGYRPCYTTDSVTNPNINDEHRRYLSFFVNYGEFISGYETYYNYKGKQMIKDVFEGKLVL